MPTTSAPDASVIWRRSGANRNCSTNRLTCPLFPRKDATRPGVDRDGDDFRIRARDLDRPGQRSLHCLQFRRCHPRAGVVSQGDVLRFVLGNLRGRRRVRARGEVGNRQKQRNQREKDQLHALMNRPGRTIIKQKRAAGHPCTDEQSKETRPSLGSRPRPAPTRAAPSRKGKTGWHGRCFNKWCELGSHYCIK